jgi:hypothetical protein
VRARALPQELLLGLARVDPDLSCHDTSGDRCAWL